MVEVIETNEPAIMVCHWPGIYFNGDKTGFNILKEVVKRLNQKYDHLLWMKLNEIARYWAARELTFINISGNKIKLNAPFSASAFTIKLNFPIQNTGIKNEGEEQQPLLRINDKKFIKSNSWYSDMSTTILCFDLKKGSSEISLTL
jgi:hypothetical protein